MTTENITSRINNLSNLNPIVIYDGIMEMVFQEERKSEKVVERKGVLATIQRVYEALVAFFRQKK